ncbi:MAG: hypothetical protein IIC78_15215 [Chloroflexi bacterium]|nr:hypothetical protein [Chloroflexota bacterium]
MDLITFQEMVERNFSYLTNEFGFSMVRKHSSESFGNALLEYQTEKTFLRIALDRSQVLIDVKPLSSTDDSWFGLPSLVEFLAPDFDETAYIFPEKWDDYDDMIEWQIERVARILRQYCEPILSGKFSKWKKVDKMRLKKIRREYKDITGEDYPL